MSRFDWPYFSEPAFLCAVFQSRSSVERLHRRRRAERRQPLVEVALHAVLERDRAVLVAAACVVGARADSPQRVVLLRILVDHARNVGGVDDDGAFALEHGDGLGHHLRLVGIQAAARLDRRRAPACGRRRTPAGCRCARRAGRRAAGTACSRAPAAACRRVSPDRSDRARRLRATPSRMAASATDFASGPGVS